LQYAVTHTVVDDVHAISPEKGCLDVSGNGFSGAVPSKLRCRFGEAPFAGNCLSQAGAQQSSCRLSPTIC
jgi:hypothetical protein